MAALAQSVTLGSDIIKKVWSCHLNFVICNNLHIYSGAFCALPGANANTSCRGYVIPWEDEVNVQWAGYALAQSWTGGLITSAQSGTVANLNSVLGNTASGNGINGQEISVETGPFILETTVTGVSAITDVWRTLVYCNTDNFADLSTTASSYAPSMGRVSYWFSSTRCQVYFHGAARMV